MSGSFYSKVKIHNPGRIAHSGATPDDGFSGGGGDKLRSGAFLGKKGRERRISGSEESTRRGNSVITHPPPFSRGLWVPLGPGASYLTYQICIHCIHSSTWGHKPNTPLNTVDTYICPCSICTSVHTYMHTQRKGSNILKAVDAIYIYFY